MKLNYILFLFVSLTLNNNLMPMEIEKFEKPKNFCSEIEPIIKKAKELVGEYRLSKTPGKPFISIAGCSAVGKSYFSEQLMQALKKEKIKAAILHLDDFMDPIPVENPLFHPHLDYVKARVAIKEILDGNESIIKPAWDLTGPEFFKIKEMFDLRGVDLIIFEGEYTLCDSDSYDFLKYSSLRIFMDAKNEDLIDWNWNRKRGIVQKTKEELAIEILKSLKKYRANIENTIKYADYFVLHNKEHVYTVVKERINNFNVTKC